MKTLTKLFAVVLLIASMNACVDQTTVVPSKTVTTQDKFIENYDGVEISTAFNVDIQYSTAYESIEIEANENLHQYIVVEKVNNILRIRLRNGVSIHGNATLKAHIITKNPLDYYSASGASIIRLENSLHADDVTINLSGASNFSGEIVTGSINAYIEGASNIHFSGSADMLNANVSGASTISGYDMVIQDATINLSGASQASLTINGAIDITASGASILRYQGSGLITDIDLSGASQVIKVD